MNVLELETKLTPFLERPSRFWPAIRFKPSAYDEVFRLCSNSLIESYDQLKAKNFALGYRPGEPSSDFFHALEMLDHLFKSIHRVPRFPWKAPQLWLGAGVLFCLFTDPHGTLFWWMVLIETILMIITVSGQNV